MARGRQTRRQAAEYDSSDEDVKDNVLQPAVDPKVVLQMADLGNVARDRMTAHDGEPDRRVNFAQINSSRKCNQLGSTEAQNAATNSKQIKGWNSFGGTDSTTNLEDISRGQYHRLTTSQKVQAETRQLRIEGIEVNAESVDDNRRSVVRTNLVNYSHRDAGRKQHTGLSKNETRPLDPAVDPDRVYKYKNGMQYNFDVDTPARGQASGRGGHGMGKGGHRPQPDREQLTNTKISPANRANLSPAQSEKGSVRTARRGGFQSQPWSPMALMGNPEPAASVLEGNASSTVSPHSKEKKLALSSEETISQEASSSFSSNAQARQPGEHAIGLGTNFDSWIRATQITGLAPVAQKPKPRVDTKDTHKKITIPRNELRKKDDVAEGSEDFRTDGRLTPVDLTSFDDLDLVSTTGPKGIDSHHSRHSTKALMDIEIPECERKVLDQYQIGGSGGCSEELLSDNPQNVGNAAVLAQRRSNPFDSPVVEVKPSPENVATRQTASTLGDCSNLQKKAAQITCAKGGLRDSRYANPNTIAYQSVHQPQNSRYDRPGPGYDRLVRELYPTKTANAAFTQYRDPPNTDHTTDEEL